MDIPQDICTDIMEFENEYCAKLLGPKWHEVLFNSYKDFKEENEDENESEEYLKAEFAKQALSSFYDEMDSIFRDGFGTVSKDAEDTVSSFSELLFDKKE